MSKKILYRVMAIIFLVIALSVPAVSPIFAQDENPPADPPPSDDLPSTEPLSSRQDKGGTGIGSDAALDPNPYGCYGQTDDPHKSSHVSGTVNVVARTECDWANVPEIYVQTTLQYWKCFWGICWWSTIGSTNSTVEYFDDDVQTNSSANCISGTHNYRGISYHYIIGADSIKYEVWTTNEKQLTC